MTTKKSKRTYNAPKGTKIIGFEMLNDGKVLLTFAEDEGEVKEVKGESLFKKGDIVAYDNISVIGIFKEYSDFTIDGNFMNLIALISGGEIYYDDNTWGLYQSRLATPEEQQTLFDALAKEGKRWNRDTLEIEDIVDEFKRGDILTAVGVGHDKSNMTFIYNHFSKYSGHFEALCGGVQINPATKKSQLRGTWFKYGFNKDKVRHATPSEIEQFDNDLKKIGKKWNRELLKVEDLDISEIVVDLKTAIDYLDCPRYTYNIDKKDKRLNKFEAQITLQLICEAWNKADGFVADWNDIEQEKYVPYRYVGSGDLDAVDAVNSSNWLGFESLIVFKSTERALQFGKQFKELFKVAMGIE